MLWCSASNYLYCGQLLFDDKYLQKSEILATHHFWFWRRVSPSGVMNVTCLVNCDTWEFFMVTWEVYIWWYHLKVGHKRKKIMLNWKLKFWCKWRWEFEIFIRKISYFVTPHFLFLLFQTWCWFCCCWSCSQGCHYKLFWINRIAWLVHPLWMKSLWPGVTKTRIFQSLHLGLRWFYLKNSLHIHWTQQLGT